MNRGAGGAPISSPAWTAEFLAAIERALAVGAFQPARAVLATASVSDAAVPRGVFLLKGQAAFFADDFPAAAAEFESILPEPSLEFAALAWLARTRAAAGQADEALGALDQLMERAKDPAHERVVHAAELIVAMTLGQWELAPPVGSRGSAARELPLAATEFDQLECLARNLCAWANRAPDRAQKLGRDRPWDRLFLAREADTWVSWARTGGDPERLIDPVEQNAHEAGALAACESRLTLLEPVLVLGTGTGRVVDELARVEPRNGRRLPIRLVTADWGALAGLLLSRDWSDLLESGVLEVFGPANQEMIEFLEADARRIPRSFEQTTCSVGPADFCGPYAARLQQYLAARDRAGQQAMRALARHYDAPDFQSRWKDWNQGSQRDPLRVLLQSCRYTTFVHANSQQLSTAFETAGCRVEFLDEGDSPQHWVGPAAVRATIERFQPDLYVRINFLRQEDSAGIPDGLPMLTWVQDECPSHTVPGVAGRLLPRDYLAGIGKPRLVEHGFPDDHFFSCPVPSLARIYRAKSDAERNYLYDVSYVSHQSEPAEQWLARQAAGRNSPEAKWLEQLAARIETLLEGPDFSRLWPTVLGELRAPDGGPPTPRMHELALQLGNLLFRHRILNWISKAGYHLALFGNGWDKHPTLGRHARGGVANGEPLREVYRASRINLQLMITGNLHQRLVDGLLAEGFFLIPRQHAGLELVGNVAGAERNLEARFDFKVGGDFGKDAHDVAFGSKHQLAEWISRQLGRSGPISAGDLPNALASAIARLLDASDGADTSEPPSWVARWAIRQIEHDRNSRVELHVPELVPLMFGSRGELLEQISKWLPAQREREDLSKRIVSERLESLTSEIMVGRVLSWIARRLMEGDPPFWLPDWLVQATEGCHYTWTMHEGDPITYMVRAHDAHQRLRARGRCRAAAPDGEWTMNFPGGSVRLTCQFTHGRLEGSWRELDSYGRPVALGQMRAGELDGTWRWIRYPEPPAGAVGQHANEATHEYRFSGGRLESEPLSQASKCDRSAPPLLVNVTGFGFNIVQHREFFQAYGPGVDVRDCPPATEARAVALYRSGLFFLAASLRELLRQLEAPPRLDPPSVELFRIEWRRYRGREK